MDRPQPTADAALDDEKPDVLDYLDFRAFIRDRIRWMSHRDSKYSQRWLAKRAGFKTPQLLSMIISGKRRLGRDRVPEICKAMSLSERESEYFRLIVELGQTDDAESQKDLLAQIKTGFRSGLFADIPDEGMEILRHWYLMAVRELVTLKDFDPDPAWISGRLGISRDEAHYALDLLLEKGFLRIEDGQYVRREPSIHTKDKIRPMLVSIYNLQILERAFKAHGYHRDKRYFESLTFAMPRRLMPHLREAIKRFFREIDTLVESHEDREEVCQLNVQLFPHTSWEDESDDES